MHRRVRPSRMKLDLSLPQRLTRLSRSSRCHRGSASASPQVRAKGAMRRVQRISEGLRVQFPTLWHQVQGLMRITHCLQTLRNVLRRKGHAIVVVVAKSGSSLSVWQRLTAVHTTSRFHGLLTLSHSDLGLRLLADPSPIKQMRHLARFRTLSMSTLQTVRIRLHFLSSYRGDAI